MLYKYINKLFIKIIINQSKDVLIVQFNWIWMSNINWLPYDGPCQIQNNELSWALLDDSSHASLNKYDLALLDNFD